MRQLVCDGEPPPCSVGRRSDEDLGRKAVRLQPAVLDEVRVRDTGHAEFLSEALYRDGDAARFWVLASHDACGVLSQCAHGRSSCRRRSQSPGVSSLSLRIAGSPSSCSAAVRTSVSYTHLTLPTIL